MFDKLEDILIRLEEIVRQLNEPGVAEDAGRFQRLKKEQAELQPIADTYLAYKKIKRPFPTVWSSWREKTTRKCGRC